MAPRSSALRSGGQSLGVDDDTVPPVKPPPPLPLLRAGRKRSSGSGDDGRLDTRLASESMAPRDRRSLPGVLPSLGPQSFQDAYCGERRRETRKRREIEIEIERHWGQ
ncbi:hypothetical protein E5288_WYG008338 [Bos mutus]|uniref:Uncharacterized protein n=1 Tax=Bos mutus TaxID=72004 RepID=A0A6B0SN03_9CETA|nr:hypothetical protein [Bos mutus]